MPKKRTDVLTPQQRSFCMSRVKSKNTKVEILVRSSLFKEGYRFRKHTSLPGKPDIVFPKKKLAVFIDGDFWHGRHFHKWSHKLKPFWYDKISKNITRDKKTKRKLQRHGWKVVRIWEKNVYKNIELELNKIKKFL